VVDSADGMTTPSLNLAGLVSHMSEITFFGLTYNEEYLCCAFATLTLPHLCNSHVPEGLAHVKFCGSQNWVYMWSTIYANICVCTRECNVTPNCNAQDPDGQHGHSAACIIVQ
jgi:hypothetical protein